jgi:hypothetical protein
MAFRTVAVVAIVIAIGLDGDPAVASTWLPSWLDRIVNPADGGTHSPTEVSSKRADAKRGRSVSCWASAAAVRKAQPKAWPKWTYGPQGERCWYAGEKPRFAKIARRQAPSKSRGARQSASIAPPRPSVAAPKPVSVAAPELDGRNTEPIPQPWAMEYRWEAGFK